MCGQPLSLLYSLFNIQHTHSEHKPLYVNPGRSYHDFRRDFWIESVFLQISKDEALFCVGFMHCVHAFYEPCW